MSWMFDNVGRLIARLQKPANHSQPFTQNDSKVLRDTLRRGDVLLVEGKSHISGGIKYSLNQPGRIRHCTSGRWRAPQPKASHTS
jgi:hypothetical protein